MIDELIDLGLFNFTVEALKYLRSALSRDGQANSPL
jgi:hypothetical protein